MRIVCNALGSVKTKSLEIGLQLGIPRSKLMEFKKEDDPLSAVVDYWLQGNVLEPAIPVCWKSIVEALNSEYVGELALAEKISKKHCQEEDTKIENGHTFSYI